MCDINYSLLKNSEECPNCKQRTYVIDSRSINGIVKRRRLCKICNHRFSTIEICDEDAETLMSLLENRDNLKELLKSLEVVTNGKSR